MLNYFDLIENRPELFRNQDAMIKVITDRKVIKKWVIERKSKLKLQLMPEKWADIGIVYEDPYILILRDLVEFPGGKLGSYFRLINVADLYGGKGSVILPIIKNKVVLLRQYRHPTRNWHWEIPRGFGEPNLTSDENARKEINEEIGGEFSSLIDLGPFHNNTGVESTEAALFLAFLENIGESNQDEGIKYFQLFEIEKVYEMIGNSEITDGFTIAAFTRARYRKLI